MKTHSAPMDLFVTGNNDLKLITHTSYVPWMHFCVQVGSPFLSCVMTSRQAMHSFGEGPVQPAIQLRSQQTSPLQNPLLQLAGQAVK